MRIFFETDQSSTLKLWRQDGKPPVQACHRHKYCFYHDTNTIQVQYKYKKNLLTNTIQYRTGRKTAGVSLLSALFWANCPFSGLNSDQNVSKYEKSLCRQKTTDIDYPRIQYGWGDSNLNPVSINVSILMFAFSWAAPPAHIAVAPSRRRYISADIPSNMAKHKDWKYVHTGNIGDRYCCCPRCSERHSNKGVKGRGNALTHCVTSNWPLSLEREGIVCLFGGVSSEKIGEEKRQSADKISHHSCWLPPLPPPFPASFVSGNCINLTIPLCAIIFHPIMNLLWGGLIFTSLLFTRTAELLSGGTYLKLDQHQLPIVSTSINTHLLATESATPANAL